MRAFDDSSPLWRRYLPQLVVLAVGLLIVVGLRARSDGDDDAGSSRGAQDQTDATIPPSSDGDGGGAAARGGIDEALLTIGNLPAGWAIAELTEATGELCPGEDPTDEVQAAASAQVAFRRSNEGPVLTNVVWEYRNAEAAGDFLDAASDAFEACATYEQGEQTLRMRRIALDDVGDEAVAARISGTSLIGEVDGRAYYVRVGDRVTAVFALAQGRLDDAVSLDALRTVVDRL